MRILYITTTLPYPPNDGERVRSYNLLSQLCKRHKITVLAFYYEESELAGISHLNNIGIEVLSFARKNTFKMALFKSIIFMHPLFVYRNYSDEAAITIAGLAKKELFDVVHLDGLPLVQYVSLIPSKLNVVFDLRDSWSVLYKRKVNNSSWPEKLLHLLKLNMVRRYENHALSLHLKTVLLSAEDKKALQNRLCNIKGKITLIPNGVDTEFFFPNKETCDNETKNIVFTGALAYPPNSEAVEYFVTAIWPLILEKLPDARFFVVGKGPGRRLLKLRSRSVEIVGEVDDLRPYIWNAKVVVCPLLSGAGIKNKVLEAMALGKVVVASPVAVEGIPGENGKHYVVCDDPQSMANAVVDLIQSKDKRTVIESEARVFVKETFCWESAAKAFEKLYAEI